MEEENNNILPSMFWWCVFWATSYLKLSLQMIWNNNFISCQVLGIFHSMVATVSEYILQWANKYQYTFTWLFLCGLMASVCFCIRMMAYSDMMKNIFYFLQIFFRNICLTYESSEHEQNAWQHPGLNCSQTWRGEIFSIETIKSYFTQQ